jgi:carbon storage regulator CsrA
MLVLQRKLGQRISINRGEIMITVVEVRNGAVRLGFAAPKNVSIMRLEIEDFDGEPVVAAIAGGEHESLEVWADGKCDQCEGKGKVFGGSCQACGGTGTR